MNYNGNIFEPQSIQGCTGTGYSNPAFADTNQDRSLLIPADGSGKVRIIYQYRGTNTAPSLMSTWDDGSSTGPTDTLLSAGPDNDQFSAVVDANYGQHLAYGMNDGTVSYRYRASLSSQCASPTNIIGGVLYDP